MNDIELFRSMNYDALANLGIRLAIAIERAAEFGAGRHERERLAAVDMVLREKERQS